jgi:hypothetical protein
VIVCAHFCRHDSSTGTVMLPSLFGFAVPALTLHGDWTDGKDEGQVDSEMVLAAGHLVVDHSSLRQDRPDVHHAHPPRLVGRLDRPCPGHGGDLKGWAMRSVRQLARVCRIVICGGLAIDPMTRADPIQAVSSGRQAGTGPSRSSTRPRLTRAQTGPAVPHHAVRPAAGSSVSLPSPSATPDPDLVRSVCRGPFAVAGVCEYPVVSAGPRQTHFRR